MRTKGSGDPLGKGLFYFLLLTAVILTLAQRAFPSQDGPLHLYYSDVLGHLLRGTGVYSGVYEIKHLLPPYAFQPYLLMALTIVMPAITAEKVLVALYIVWFCVSFRYLVHTVDAGNELVPLFAVPLAFNKLVFMGFYSFSFGVATAMFAAALWLRFYDRFNARRAAAFLATVLLLLSMHPVALLLGLVFVAMHLSLVLIGHFRTATGTAPARVRGTLRAWWTSIACAIAAALTMTWILGFRANGKPVVQLPHEPPRILQLLKLTAVSPFSGAAFRLLLFALLAALVVAAGLRVLRSRPTMAMRDWALAAMAAACAVAYLLVPWEVNSGAHFPDRFPIFALVFAGALAAGLRLGRALERGLAVALTVAVFGTLVWQGILKQRILVELNPVYEAETPERNVKAAIVASIPLEERDRTAYNFLPEYWAAAHYMRRAHATFLNATWLETPVMILKPRHEIPCSYSDAYPMLQCLAGGTAGVEPDVMLVTNGGGDERPVVRLARSLGLVRQPFQSPLLELYARPNVLSLAGGRAPARNN